MKKRYAVLLVVLIVCATGLGFKLKYQRRYRYPFAVCAMFKNEAPWLKEWIDYHHTILGATHFYLYNNDSQDHFMEVLNPYIKSGLVEVIPWDTCEEHAIRGIEDVVFIPYQLGAYNDCMKRARGEAEWVAIIDIDEFIVPVQGAKAFTNLLKEESSLKTGSLQMYWRVFGTSHVNDLHEGELLTEKLTLRAADDHPWNSNMKSIHRPEAIKFTIVHEARKLKHGFKRKKLDPELWRIHHYWSRTENYFIQKRKPTPEKRDFFEAFNLVEDKSMEQFLPKLKHVVLQKNSSKSE